MLKSSSVALILSSYYHNPVFFVHPSKLSKVQRSKIMHLIKLLNEFMRSKIDPINLQRTHEKIWRIKCLYSGWFFCHIAFFKLTFFEGIFAQSRKKPNTLSSKTEKKNPKCGYLLKKTFSNLNHKSPAICTKFFLTHSVSSKLINSLIPPNWFEAIKDLNNGLIDNKRH